MGFYKPTVSIITPTFNHELYIGECIDSVINQTFKDWEMIIIDDGSTDNTSNIISNYSDERIIYIKQKNRGPYRLGETYNRALNKSKGDFIAILEGDDFWPAKKLEHQLPLFQNNEVVMTHGRAKYFYDFGGLRKYKNMHLHEIKAIMNNEPIGMALYGLLGVVGVCPVAVTTMYRKSTLLSIGGFKQPNCVPLVDNPTQIAISMEGKFSYLPKILGYYRKHPMSIQYHTRRGKMDVHASKYQNDFIDSNKESILNMGIDLKKFENLHSDETRFKYGLISYGRELLELNEMGKAKKIFKKSLADFGTGDPYYNLLLSYLGLLSANTSINFSNFFVGIYARLNTIYWNFKFNIKQ